MSSAAAGCTLIINADDFGYEPNVTRGIAASMVEGVVSSTTFMVNGPHSQQAAQAAAGRQLAIGLHFNLARWAPLSRVPKQFLTPSGELDERQASRLPAEVVHREVDAQLARLEQLLGTSATHLDVHKHLHRHPAVLEGICQAALVHRLPVRSIDAPMRQTLKQRGVATNDAFIGDAGTSAYWTLEVLEQQLAALPRAGIVELMCHPGYAPTLIASGYGKQREVELLTFTHPTARALLERRELIPASWQVFRSL